MFGKVANWWVGLTKGPATLLFSKIKNNGTVKSFSIYGAGEIGSELIELLKQDGGYQVEHVFDRNAEFVDLKVADYTVKKPSDMSEMDIGTLVIASEQFADEIQKSITEKMPGNMPKLIRI